MGITAWVIVSTADELAWSDLVRELSDMQYGWVVLSIAISILSHVLRAYRWKLLLNTGGYHPRVSTAYLALMTGYLANMAIPRLGEVIRCTALNSEEDIPLSFSLGTVVTDRLLDLLMLMILATSLIFLEFELLGDYFIDFVNNKTPVLISLWPYLLLAGLLAGAFLFWLFKRARTSEQQSGLLYKVRQFIKGMISGIKAIKRIERPAFFWLSTIGIWALYFLMLYIISFGFRPTDDLSLTAGLAVLVMGSLGMATPVNNGIGAYQAFVASILVLYGINYNDGYIFAVISHGSQVLSVILIGFISLMILNFRKRKKKVVGQ